ncbi:MAG TPA: caspase family protein [Bradyrhizobium sp.]|jgi:hypothetical protein|nr:caspase family protein [Bradyrhizobium sp.]
MALVIDNRATVKNEPGVHLLIVGVSQYVNLPDHDDIAREETWFLNKLTSPALSAFKIYQFLTANNALALPLKTARLLLSPSQLEVNNAPALATAGAGRANRAAFEADALDWREDAKTNPKDMTIFYFSGHGMQRGPDDGVLMLEDFLAPGGKLNKCFEVSDIKAGMAPSETFPDIALTQFYFVDACMAREAVQTKFVSLTVPEVFSAELNVVDKRWAPIIFSAVDGAVSLGLNGKPSHFSEALTLALERGAEEAVELDGNTVWPITPLTIKTAVDLYYRKHQLGDVKLGGIVGEPVIRYLPGPPDVDISVIVTPDALGTPPPCSVSLFDDNGVAVPACSPTLKTQFETTVKAGIYRISVDSAQLKASPYRSPSKFLTQKGPRPWLHNVTSLLK